VEHPRLRAAGRQIHPGADRQILGARQIPDDRPVHRDRQAQQILPECSGLDASAAGRPRTGLALARPESAAGSRRDLFAESRRDRPGVCDQRLAYRVECLRLVVVLLPVPRLAAQPVPCTQGADRSAASQLDERAEPPQARRLRPQVPPGRALAQQQELPAAVQQPSEPGRPVFPPPLAPQLLTQPRQAELQQLRLVSEQAPEVQQAPQVSPLPAWRESPAVPASLPALVVPPQRAASPQLSEAQRQRLGGCSLPSRAPWQPLCRLAALKRSPAVQAE